PPRIPAWPWALGASLAGIGTAFVPWGQWSSGIFAGVLILALALYAVAKRTRSLARLRGNHALARRLYIAHLSLGMLACGATVGHAGLRAPPNIAGALSLVIALAIVTGLFGWMLVALVPRALSRIERASVLPEELGALPRQLDERIFATLSGKSELVKV